MTTKLYGGLEAGGTKFVCAVGAGPDDLRAETRFPTTTPAETIGRALDFFRAHPGLTAIGVASFGPVDLNLASPTYGFITTTPKPHWAHTDLLGPLRQALNVPIGFDTDVNGAALGEWRWGAGRGLSSVLYLTIGTGIGGGLCLNGQPLHGLLHPEMGHILLRRDPRADPFPGLCPYHGDCFEGLASGPALEQRWNAKAETLGDDHPAWALEAQYIAQALSIYICTLSPQRILLGGGVMAQTHLFPRVRAETQRRLNGYIQAPALSEHMDAYLVPPGLGLRAGVLGALALAQAQSQ